MASETCSRHQRQNYLLPLWGTSLLAFLSLVPAAVQAQSPLSTSFYDASCPNLQPTVRAALYNEMRSDFRVGASLLRLMFHDCFVQGCDASILLDDTPASLGEKQAIPNNNSLRAFSAFDNIKAAVENVCPGVVSCADILVIVARDAVVAGGGPSWNVELGRRDALTGSFDLANSDLPRANNDANELVSKFAAKGLSETEMVALAGAHTFGKAQCGTFRFRLYDYQGTGFSGPDPTLDPAYLALLQAACPPDGLNTTTVDLDQATPGSFDNSYYSNLLLNKGVLTSDESLQYANKATASSVNKFAVDQNQFFAQFSWAMTKMGRISPLTGTAGQIRCNCRVANPK